MMQNIILFSTQLIGGHFYSYLIIKICLLSESIYASTIFDIVATLKSRC